MNNVKQTAELEENIYALYRMLSMKEMYTNQLLEIFNMKEWTIRKMLNILVKDGYVTYEDKMVHAENSRVRRVFKATNKQYIPKTAAELKALFRSTNVTLRKDGYAKYGMGAFEMPWAPKVPQVDAKPKTFKLLDTKDADYFHAPLKKSKPISIGSTFSLFDGVTA